MKPWGIVTALVRALDATDPLYRKIGDNPDDIRPRVRALIAYLEKVPQMVQALDKEVQELFRQDMDATEPYVHSFLEMFNVLRSRPGHTAVVRNALQSGTLYLHKNGNLHLRNVEEPDPSGGGPIPVNDLWLSRLYLVFDSNGQMVPKTADGQKPEWTTWSLAK